jgi:hypothetical protein
MAQGTPEGYTSYQAAFEDLMEFGGAISTPFEMVAMLFHVRRARGKDSDAHSQKQATEGIYSASQKRWICGPVGMSRAMWKRVNAALAAKGFLLRTRRTNKFGKDDPTEYALNWLAISRAIENWKRETTPRVATAEPLGRPAPPLRVATTEPVSGYSVATPVATTEPHIPDRIRVATAEPHLSQSQSLTSKVSHFTRACGVVRNAIEHATKDIVQDDRLIYAILEHGCRTDLPPAAQARCIEWLIYDRKAVGYQPGAGLVLRIVREDSVAWARENGPLVFRLQMEAREEGWSPQVLREEAGRQLALGAAFKMPSTSERLQPAGKAKNQTA